MTKDQVIETLFRNYDFTKDETEIITFLSQNEASAETILKNTTVSNGRIYKILAELEKTGIITKEGVKPSLYSMEPLRECINKFLDYKLNLATKSQVDVLNAVSNIESKSAAEVLYGSKKNFDMEIIKMNQSCKWLKLIHKEEGVPWFLYSYFNDEDFLKIRGYMEKHRNVGSSSHKFDLLQKRSSYTALYAKKSVAHVMHQRALTNYRNALNAIFGDAAGKYFGAITKELTNHSNVKIFVSPNLRTPFSVYIYDKEVIMPIFTRKDQNRMLKMSGSDFIDVYSEFFDSSTTGASVLTAF